MEHVVVAPGRGPRRRRPRRAGRPGDPRPGARDRRALTARVGYAERRRPEDPRPITRPAIHGHCHRRRDELLALHVEPGGGGTPRQLGSPEHVAAIDEIGRSRSRSPASSGRWTARSADRATTPSAEPDARPRRPTRDRRVRIYEVGPRDGLQNEATPIPTADQGAVHRAAGRRPACARSRRPASSRRGPSPSWPTPTSSSRRSRARARGPLSGPRPERARHGPGRGGRRRRARGLHRGDRCLHRAANIGMTVDESLAAFAPVLARPASSAGGGGATSRPRSAARTPAASSPARGGRGRAPPARARRRRGLLRRHDRRRRAGPGRGAHRAGGRTPASRPNGSPSTSTTRAAPPWPTSRPGCEPASAASTPSTGGTGGCPYAPGAAGNLATEDLVYFLDASGWEHGVDLDGVLDRGALHRRRSRPAARRPRSARPAAGIRPPARATFR